MCHMSVFHGSSAHSCVMEEAVQPQVKGIGLHCKFITWDTSAIFMISLLRGMDLDFFKKQNKHALYFIWILRLTIFL